MTLHDFVAPYEFLIGTWEGPGRGYYPTIEDFQYRESITFSAAPGKPFLKYEQHTTSPDGAAMHTEVGYLRPHEGGFIEVARAPHPRTAELVAGTPTVNDHPNVPPPFRMELTSTPRGAICGPTKSVSPSLYPPSPPPRPSC